MKPRDTRQRILESARDLYVSEGFAGLSMRRVAERAGLSATAIYRYFKDKEALLSATCEEGFRLFGEHLYGALKGETPLERYRLAGEAYLRFALENSRDYRVMFMSNAEDWGLVRMPEQNQERFSPTFRFLVDRVRECMEAGVMRPGDPGEIAGVIWAHVHGLVSLRLAGHLPGEDEAFIAFYRRSSQVLLQGLAP
jgi:AcrR family transcriptional regulator